MNAQILILKDLWKRMTNVDNPRVTLSMGIILIAMAYAYFCYLMLFPCVCLKILGTALLIELNILGICMLHETIRLKRISKDKGYWFWGLNPNYINKMNSGDFEECIGWIFTMHGYKSNVLRKHSHEHGADIIAEKDNELLAIQVKCWKNKVGKSSVNQVLKSIDYYHPTQLIVVTNNEFSKPAYEYANSKGVKLINHDELIRLYKESKDIYKTNKSLNKNKNSIVNL